MESELILLLETFEIWSPVEDADFSSHRVASSQVDHQKERVQLFKLREATASVLMSRTDEESDSLQVK